jgi:AMMECR1 domain-containing protein
LLLPQVPAEHGWDLKTFLEQTCRKAGLPPDAWEHGATLEAFTAEIFGEGVL